MSFKFKVPRILEPRVKVQRVWKEITPTGEMCEVKDGVVTCKDEISALFFKNMGWIELSDAAPKRRPRK